MSCGINIGRSSKLRTADAIDADSNANDKLSSASKIPLFTLANNSTVPLIGLGTASGVRYVDVKSAIGLGYQFVDTAQSHSWGYHEEEVGQALHDAKRRYQDNNDDFVFVQTKIHPQDLGYHSTKKAIQLSLERLQVTSLDSVLIHKPHCWGDICSREPEGTWEDSWKALEEAVDSGLVRTIGICDVDIRLLEKLLSKRIAPMIIQNWFDPFHQDKALRRRIESINREQDKLGKVDKKILYQGYSTLGNQWKHQGYQDNPVMTSRLLLAIAKKYGVSIPEVLIQWSTRRGVMVLPASKNPSHQLSNLKSYDFTLTEEEMTSIDSLDGEPPKELRTERDTNEVDIQFSNHVDGPVDVFWVDSNEDHVHVGSMLKDATLSITSYHGHSFVFKKPGADSLLNLHIVDKSFGSTQNHQIEDRSEEL
jgi:diketogulonate reductase-like aldo/keto reductase